MCNDHVRVDRRTFVKGLSATAAAAAFTALGTGTAAAASKTLPNGKIGLQLYSVRDAFMADPEAVLAKLAAAGYRNVEFAGLPGGTTPANAPAVRALLDRYEIKAVSSHHGYGEFTDDNRLTELIEMARILGQRYIVCPGGVPDTAEGFKAAGAAFNRAGERIREAGMRLGYHNHTGEFEHKDANGKSFYEILTENSKPYLLYLELDIGWSTAAGEDAIALLRRYRDRIVLTHMKDLNSSGGLADLGTGVIDWAPIVKAAERYGVREYIIENDDQSDPRTDGRAAAMHEYLDDLRY